MTKKRELLSDLSSHSPGVIAAHNEKRAHAQHVPVKVGSANATSRYKPVTKKREMAVSLYGFPHMQCVIVWNGFCLSLMSVSHAMSLPT